MLETFSKLMEYCTYCPRLCQSACPVAMTEGNESFSPWGLMQTLNQLRKGEIPLDSELAALSYKCLTCKACTTQCEHGNEIPPVLHEVRKEAVARELAPPEISGFLNKFHKHNNPFSKDLLQKLKNILPSKYFDMNPQTIYYPSCTTIAKCPEVVHDTFELFEKLKIDFVGVYPEAIQCCGYPLISGGMEYDFIDLAEVNFHALKKYKTIVSGSPACVYTLRETYKKYDFGLPGKVVTINEFLEPYLHNINYRLKKSMRTKLMYHDPCYLSRYLNEVSLPRELIAHVSGYQPMEFFDHGECTHCSGQGGCYSITSKEASDEIARRRLEEVVEKKVQTLVTQCPSCVHKFRKNSERLVVKDLISYLNDSIEGVKE
ncbi:MAG: (Fe-S)-binding protein [Deltaproteobacteria bacterium]|nr:(Fe-S)-binding protein [Deltaproteobacteria bacterium]